MLDDGRVPGIQQAHGIAPAPSRNERQVDLKRRRDPADAPHREPIELPAFEQRDETLAHPGSQPKLPLRPAEAMANGAHQRADTEIIHVPMVPATAVPDRGCRGASTAPSRG